MAAQDTIDTTEAITPKADYSLADTTFYKVRSFDADFREKYTDSDFQYETKTQAKSGWDRFWEAVGRFFDELFDFSGNGNRASGYTLLKYIIAIVVMLFSVYMIVRAVLNKESMWIFGKSGKKITMQDVAGEDIMQMDFKQLIQETKNKEDYRLSVRYYYLWLLKELSEREIINWHWDKTNSDYLYEIKNAGLKKDFEYLSYVYDYSWYGEFPIDEVAFAKVERVFRKNLKAL